MTDDTRPKIAPRKDGPLVVKGLRSMKDTQGDGVEIKPVVALCRCGQSKNKPFCDGSHATTGFNSEAEAKPAGIDKVIEYEGAKATVTYNPRLCSHAAECGRLASNIFNPSQKPWIQPDNGTLDEVMAVVTACPSGALAIKGPQHRLSDGADIEVEPNGPYWVKGCDIDAPAPGLDASSDKFVLCRCGLSGNKPYCDGSHRDQGWIID